MSMRTDADADADAGKGKGKGKEKSGGKEHGAEGAAAKAAKKKAPVRTMTVRVPPGTSVGDELTVTTSDGRMVNVVIPAGAKVGQKFKVSASGGCVGSVLRWVDVCGSGVSCVHAHAYLIIRVIDIRRWSCHRTRIVARRRQAMRRTREAQGMIAGRRRKAVQRIRTKRRRIPASGA